MSDEFETVIGRAVTNPQFREQLITNPEKALQQFNVTLQPAELANLKKMSVDQRTKAFEDLTTRQQKVGDVVLCGNW